MRRRFALIICFLLAVGLAAGVAAGCGSEKSNGEAANSASVTKKSGGTLVVLTVKPRETKTGTDVAMTLTVTNTTGKPQGFTLPSTQAFDFTVFYAKGGQVYQWSQGKAFAQVITTVTIDPARSKIYAVTWDTTGQSAGDYQVDGVFKGLPGVQPRATMTLTAD